MERKTFRGPNIALDPAERKSEDPHGIKLSQERTRLLTKDPIKNDSLLNPLIIAYRNDPAIRLRVQGISYLARFLQQEEQEPLSPDRKIYLLAVSFDRNLLPALERIADTMDISLEDYKKIIFSEEINNIYSIYHDILQALKKRREFKMSVNNKTIDQFKDQPIGDGLIIRDAIVEAAYHDGLAAGKELWEEELVNPVNEMAYDSVSQDQINRSLKRLRRDKRIPVRSRRKKNNKPHETKAFFDELDRIYSLDPNAAISIPELAPKFGLTNREALDRYRYASTTKKLPPLDKRQTDREGIKEVILETIKRGDKVNILQVAKQFGANRTTIRNIYRSMINEE